MFGRNVNELILFYLRGPGGQYSFVALQNPDITWSWNELNENNGVK